MRLGTSVNNREVNQPNLIIRSPRAGSMIPLSLYTHLRVEFYEYSNLVKRGEYVWVAVLEFLATYLINWIISWLIGWKKNCNYINGKNVCRTVLDQSFNKFRSENNFSRKKYVYIKNNIFQWVLRLTIMILHNFGDYSV